VRVAAVDAGSNALRLSVTEFHDPAASTVLAYERYPLRLGHDVFLTGRLSEESMRSALRGLGAFQERIGELGAALRRAVATSAVRESRNAEVFLRRVRDEVGMDLELISGSEEARLIHYAVRSRVPLGRQRWILADLGGGSVEVSLADEDGVLWSESHSMGSVRLLEELRGAGEEPGRFRRLLGEYIATLRVPSLVRRKKPAGFIATGGNIESLARLAGHAEKNGVSRLGLADLRLLIDKLARLSFRDRIRELDLREDRADVILPAALVYERLAVLAGVEEVLVPYVGLREGITLDLVQGYVHREDFRQRQVVESAIALGRKYLFEEKHARQVARFSMVLFDQLDGLHGLGGEDRRILLAAALLHEIGCFISFKKHHKHSLYLISQSELPGFSGEDMQLVANVARYHRRSPPSPRHDQFAGLSEDRQDRVHRMASLIRLADALDREHLQKISSLRAEVREDEVVLHARGSGDLLLERWAFQNKSDCFSRLFNLRVALATTEED
jgi:exopolyphosphatase/guanosine-5'-triphosphate,3'-diphosphate pyrophosphatase